jgi:hypothetical protein
LSGGRDPDDVLNVPRDRINSGLDALIYIADQASESLDGPGLSLSNPDLLLSCFLDEAERGQQSR